MSLLPTTQLVAEAWLRLAVPGVQVGDGLPAETVETATTGFVRCGVVGGAPDRYVPIKAPVVAAECWLSPDPRTGSASQNRADQLGARIEAASYDPALAFRQVTLPGDYLPARVLTVVVIGGPTRVKDPGDWARTDLDLLISWRVDA